MATSATDHGRIAVDTDDRDDLVTGEAVALAVRPTSFVLRAAGCIIDTFAVIAVYVGSLLLLFATIGDQLDQAMATALSTILLVLCLVGIPTAVETLSRGRSLGRLAVGARIVRDDGGAIGFRHAFIRALVGVVEIVMTFGGIAAVVGLMSSRTRRLGDILAGTFSQQERVPRPTVAEIVVPQQLEAWAATADVARMPDALARRVAYFIRQSAGMNPESRERLAASLADEVARYVHPVPPASAAAFLLAVAAMRRQREAVALGREAAQLERLGPVLDAAPRGFPDRG